MQAYVVRVRAEDARTGDVRIEQHIELASSRREAEVQAVRDAQRFYPQRAVGLV